MGRKIFEGEPTVGTGHAAPQGFTVSPTRNGCFNDTNDFLAGVERRGRRGMALVLRLTFAVCELDNGSLRICMSAMTSDTGRRAPPPHYLNSN